MNQTTSKIILILASIIYGLAFIPSILFTMMSPMVSDGNPPRWLTMWIMLGCAAIPLAILAALITGWILYNKGLYLPAVLVNIIPLAACILQIIPIYLVDNR